PAEARAISSGGTLLPPLGGLRDTDSRELIWQLRRSKMLLFDPTNERSHLMQLTVHTDRSVSDWVSHPDRLPFGARNLDRLRQVAVIGNDECNIEGVFTGVVDQVDCQVHVRSLFLRLDHLNCS